MPGVWLDYVTCSKGRQSSLLQVFTKSFPGDRSFCLFLLWLSNGMMCSLDVDNHRAVGFCLLRVTSRLDSPAILAVGSPWQSGIFVGSVSQCCCSHLRVSAFGTRRCGSNLYPKPRQSPKPQLPRCSGCIFYASSLGTSLESRGAGRDGAERFNEVGMRSVANSFLLKPVKQ